MKKELIKFLEKHLKECRKEQLENIENRWAVMILGEEEGEEMTSKEIAESILDLWIEPDNYDDGFDVWLYRGQEMLVTEIKDFINKLT